MLTFLLIAFLMYIVYLILQPTETSGYRGYRPRQFRRNRPNFMNQQNMPNTDAAAWEQSLLPGDGGAIMGFDPVQVGGGSITVNVPQAPSDLMNQPVTPGTLGPLQPSPQVNPDVMPLNAGMLARTRVNTAGTAYNARLR